MKKGGTSGPTHNDELEPNSQRAPTGSRESSLGCGYASHEAAREDETVGGISDLSE